MSETQPGRVPPPLYPPYAAVRSGLPGWVWEVIYSGAVLLALVSMLYALQLLINAGQHAKMQSQMCLSNMKQCGVAIQMYAQDYNERLPRSGEWMDVLLPYTKNRQVFHCPTVVARQSDAFGYAFDSGLSGKNKEEIEGAEKRLLLYDSTNLRRNATDAQASLPSPPRHRGKNQVCYVDGHAKWLEAPLNPKQP